MENNEILNIDIKGLGLGARCYNALNNYFRSNNLEFNLTNVLNLNVKELQSIRNLGVNGINELLNAIHLLGLKFSFENDVPVLNDDNKDLYIENQNKLKELYLKKQLIIEELDKEIERLKKEQEALIFMSKQNKNEESNLKM